MFVRLCIFQRQLQTNYSWFQQTKSFRCWSKSNSTNIQGVAGGDDNTKIRLYTILEKSKETVLELYKGTAKVLWITYMVEHNKVNVKLSDALLKKNENCC